MNIPFKFTCQPLSFIGVILVGVVLTRTATSLSLPFLALVLHQQLGLNLSTVGTIIGLFFLAYVIGGFLGGIVADRFDYSRLIRFALLALVLVFIGFGKLTTCNASANTLGLCFALVNFIAGLSYAWCEVIGKALLAQVTSPTLKAKVFGLRYMAVNIGTVMGPLLGAFLGVSGHAQGFYITATLIALYSVIFSVVQLDKTTKTAPIIAVIIRQCFKQNLTILLNDSRLRHYIFAGMLVFMGYSLQETLFSQLISDRMHNNHLFPLLLSLNALLAICLQMPMMRLLKDKSPLNGMLAGSLLIALGLLIIALASRVYAWYFIGECVFTLGELWVFPFFNIVIDQLAPPALRGAYFGASSLQSLGRAMGPAIGGSAIHYLGDVWGLVGMALIVLCSIPFYLKASIHWKKSLCKPLAMKERRS